MDPLRGQATAEGTKRFVERFPQVREARGYREAMGLQLSTVGLGTYLGEVSEDRDRGYREAVSSVLSGGVNVFDTAINYRHQRSERVLGEALRAFVDEGGSRDEVFVATKGGYLPLDADVEDPHKEVREQYLDKGLVTSENMVVDAHCIAPAYLEDQIQRSRRNLGLETIDLYYVHNPETQLAQVPRGEFERRLRDAFVALEHAVERGEVARYGIATWQGLRSPPDHKAHTPLARVVELAREAAVQVGHESHSFAAVQAPLNLAMPEAVTVGSQPVDSQLVSLSQAVRRLGVAWFTSASIMQGQLAQGLPLRLQERIGAVGDAAQTALQAARSAPGVTSALVGMSSGPHVEAAVGLLSSSPPGASGVWPEA